MRDGVKQAREWERVEQKESESEKRGEGERRERECVCVRERQTDRKTDKKSIHFRHVKIYMTLSSRHKRTDVNYVITTDTFS